MLLERKAPEPYIGRQEQIEWFAKILFSHRHWGVPFVVTGPPGCGKTALVAKFLDLYRDQIHGYWVGQIKPTDVEVLYDAIEMDLRTEGRRRREDVVVVLDDVGAMADEELVSLARRIRNYKVVRAVVITTDRELSIEKAPVLTMKPIGRYDVEELLRYAGVEVPDHVVDELALRIGNKATMLPIVAGALKAEGIDGLTKLLKLPLYSVTDDIPKGKIVALAKPALIRVADNIIEELRKQPDRLYDLTSRRFEELLADLLADQGMEVQLTQETRDGGRDIIAEYETPAGRILCLVDAKKYRRDRTIGVGLVRQLHGTLQDHKATTAMMVTTSTYSPDAQAYQQRHKWHLNLRDYRHIVEWLGSYKKSKSGLIVPKDCDLGG